MIPVSILPASLHVLAGALEWKHPMHVPNYYCLTLAVEFVLKSTCIMHKSSEIGCLKGSEEL